LLAVEVVAVVVQHGLLVAVVGLEDLEPAHTLYFLVLHTQ
jgi:hypothetical protein